MQPLSQSMRTSLEGIVREAEANTEHLEYLQGRGIDLESIADFRLGYVADPDSEYCGFVTIPYLMPDGHPVAVKFRNLEPDAKPKYLNVGGASSRLFNPRALHDDSLSIHVTEGEFDAIILSQCGLTAVAVPGATQWRDSESDRRATRWSTLLQGYESVRVWADNDDAGKGLYEAIADSLVNAERVKFPAEYNDVNEFYLSCGSDGIMEVAK